MSHHIPVVPPVFELYQIRLFAVSWLLASNIIKVTILNHNPNAIHTLFSLLQEPEKAVRPFEDDSPY